MSTWLENWKLTSLSHIRCHWTKSMKHSISCTLEKGELIKWVVRRKIDALRSSGDIFRRTSFFTGRWHLLKNYRTFATCRFKCMICVAFSDRWLSPRLHWSLPTSIVHWPLRRSNLVFNHVTNHTRVLLCSLKQFYFDFIAFVRSSTSEHVTWRQVS